MGRSMIIILSGVLVAMGYMGLGNNQQGKLITAKNAGYAEFVMAKNTAHTAVQMAMQKINEDALWAYDHGSGNPWVGEVDGTPFELYVEYIHDSADYWKPDTIRIVSKSSYHNDRELKIINVYVKNALDYVPEFKSPLTIATNNFTFSQSGSSSINGYEQSGSTGCEDKPGITVMDDSGATEVSTASDVQGDPPVNTDTTTSYLPTDELIARLAGLSSTQYISGNYKGDMGSENDPGVFFVEENATLTGGISEGFGILVVRSGGYMNYQDSTGTELDIAGNFKFNGLVVFENAYNFDGKGTPTISGSVLVGNTPDYNGTIDIDINGNLDLQYDCTSEEFADKAAATAVKQNKYKRISSYE